MDQPRYLFALACFEIDLLNEAEAALSPTNESGLEVPNGAAGHYLLGLVYRYTNRNKSAVHHFRQALSFDPLFWAAYEELCMLGSAEEAAVAFGEAAVLAIQNQQLQVTCQDPFTCNEDHIQVYENSFEDASPRQLENIHRNTVQDASGSYQRTVISSATINQPPICAPRSLSFFSTPSPIASQATVEKLHVPDDLDESLVL